MDILVGDLSRDRRCGFLAIRSIDRAHTLGGRWDAIFASHGEMWPVDGIDVCAQRGGQRWELCLSYYRFIRTLARAAPPHLKGCITAE